eukprot:1185619-Prorocentrum_minimum.AAC.5
MQSPEIPIYCREYAILLILRACMGSVISQAEEAACPGEDEGERLLSNLHRTNAHRRMPDFKKSNGSLFH